MVGFFEANILRSASMRQPHPDRLSGMATQRRGETHTARDGVAALAACLVLAFCCAAEAGDGKQDPEFQRSAPPPTLTGRSR